MWIQVQEMFTFIRKKIFSYVMGSIASIVRAKEEAKPAAQLEAHEIEFLLTLMKNASFKGRQVEIVYTTAAKLQQQYMSLQNQ
jgi:hypothetical protein